MWRVKFRKLLGLCIKQVFAFLSGLSLLYIILFYIHIYNIVPVFEDQHIHPT